MVVGGWMVIGGGVKVEWLSVSQLSQSLEIPETTTRRYLNTFKEYFRWEQIGRGKKYDPNSIEILQRIAVLYSTDRETFEIKKILANEYAFIIDGEDKHRNANEPPAYDISGKLDEFQENQDNFNKQLLNLLHEQQRYINTLIKNQKEKSIEQEKYLMKPEEQNKEFFNRIIIEHKVKNKLEEEAQVLWNSKPETERMKSVGWFKVKEDKEKKDTFIKKYINEKFEKEIKKELNI